MKKFKLILFMLISVTIIRAQETPFPFGKPTSEEFELKKYDKDTTANAVVLREFGTAYISNSGDFNLMFEYHVRIKIFNEKGFDHGDISINLHRSDNNTFESIRGIEAITFYPDEQGLIRSSTLDPKQIFKENAHKYREITKFAMPNLKPGCIIEYKYTIESPFIRNFRTWKFQAAIPKIYSEYLARIPAVYNYNISLRGPYKLTQNTGKVEKECFQPGGGFKADCSAMTYAMADVPAFIGEDNMTAASNFLSAMYFELSDYTDYRGTKHKVTQEWSSIDRDLKAHQEFGKQLKKMDFFNEKLPAITGVTDPLTKAKLIYGQLQNWFRWNNVYGIYSENGIRKAFDSHTGNVADINLALCAAMMSAGLDAEAVLLSTRDNGLINKLFPVTSDFDYVICKVNIGDRSYLLDATDPLLPFDLLPLRCINDQGRVMSLNKPSYWVDLKAAQKESRTYSLDLVLEDDGKITGSVSFISYGYAAFKKRREIKKYSSVDEYVEKVEERLPKMKILASTIDNIDTLDKPVTENYKIEISAFDDLNKQQLFFNPFFMDRVSENPFKLAERSYPVDLGAPSETRVLMQLSYPEKFEVTGKPDAIGLALPNKGGRFLMQISHDENKLSFYQLTQLDKSIYEPEEYPYLKELFNKIVLSQKADIVLKKKI